MTPQTRNRRNTETAPAADETAPAETAPAADETAPAETAPAADETAPAETDDFTFTVADAPADALPSIKRKREPKPNPLALVLRQSYETDKPKIVTVPVAKKTVAVNHLRRAANVMKIGVRIVEQEPVDGKVTIVFQGKKRAERKKKDAETVAPETTETAPAETAPAENSENTPAE